MNTHSMQNAACLYYVLFVCFGACPLFNLITKKKYLIQEQCTRVYSYEYEMYFEKNIYPKCMFLMVNVFLYFLKCIYIFFLMYILLFVIMHKIYSAILQS